MSDKTIDNKKIDIQIRQDAIDPKIVDRNSRWINLTYYIDRKTSLKKKLKACNRKIVQLEFTPKNNQLLSNYIKHT